MLRLDEAVVTSKTEVGIRITKFVINLERMVLRVEYVTLDENEAQVEQKSVSWQGTEAQEMIMANGVAYEAIKSSLYNKLMSTLEISGTVE
jgi:hypothetical protein